MRRVAFLAACLVVAAAFIGGSCGTDPSTPSKPDGKTTVYQYAPEQFRTVSKSTKDVQYVFNWGDNTFDTTVAVTGGETTGLDHAWLTAGTYKVSAMAINVDAKVSAWSEELSVTVTEWNRPPPPDSIQGQDAGTPRDKILIWTRCVMPNPTDSVWIQFTHASSNRAQSAWLPALSGEYVYDTVKYTTQGQYEIWANSKDVHGAVSEPSPTKLINIGPVGIGWYRWTDAGDEFLFSPAITVDGTSGALKIYAFADGSDSIYMFTDDGGRETKLAAPLPEEGANIASSPSVSADGSKLFVGCEDGKLYCLDANSLVKLWAYLPPEDTNKLVFATPAVKGNDAVYSGREDGWFYAVAASNGAPKWRFQAGSTISFPAAIASDGRVFFGNDSSGMYCLRDDGATYTQLWTNPIGGGLTTAPALDANGNVWVGCEDGALYLLNASDSGKVIWKSDTTSSNFVGSAVISADGTVYAVREDGTAYAFRDTIKVWEHVIENASIASAPCLAPDTTIIYHSDDDVIIALHQTTGFAQWQFQLPEIPGKRARFANESSSSPSIGPTNQRIYVGGANAFYAVSVDKASFAAGLPPGAWPKFQHDLKNSGWSGGFRAF